MCSKERRNHLLLDDIEFEINPSGVWVCWTKRFRKEYFIQNNDWFNATNVGRDII